MNHLKSHNIFESKMSWDDLEEIQNIINDVLEDLRDDGFRCRCNVGYGCCPSVEIRVYKDKEASGFNERSFEFYEIEDVMKRIYTILKEKSNNIKFYFIKHDPDGDSEYDYEISKYGFGLLKSEFSEYYDHSSGGFMVDFDLHSKDCKFKKKEDDIVSERFNIKNIKSKIVREAIDVIESYGVKVKIVKMDYEGVRGVAKLEENTIAISPVMFELDSVDDILTVLFHELGHFYCYDNKIFKGYHYGFYKNKISEDELKAMVRTAIRAEAYVDKWGMVEMKKYFPDHKYRGRYMYKRKWIKEAIVNYLYDCFADDIVRMETKKLGKILTEMGI